MPMIHVGYIGWALSAFEQMHRAPTYISVTLFPDGLEWRIEDDDLIIHLRESAPTFHLSTTQYGATYALDTSDFVRTRMFIRDLRSSWLAEMHTARKHITIAGHRMNATSWREGIGLDYAAGVFTYPRALQHNEARAFAEVAFDGYLRIDKMPITFMARPGQQHWRAIVRNAALWIAAGAIRDTWARVYLTSRYLAIAGETARAFVRLSELQPSEEQDVQTQEETCSDDLR